MSSFYGIMKKEEVVDSKTLAQYVQQKLGTPYPTTQGMIVLRKNIKVIFKLYPDADYQTLVKVVDWAKAKGKKFAHCHNLVAAYRYAWRDGYLPELDPNPTKEIDKLIDQALEKETDPEWCRRLRLSSGVEARTAVYEAWKRKEAADERTESSSKVGVR